MLPQEIRFDLAARCLALLVIFASAAGMSGAADEPSGSRAPGSLQATALEKLSDANVSPLGRNALQIQPSNWKHAETENFVYHYFNSFIATPVSVESEFYYRVIARDLGRGTSEWERKCHIFLFEEPATWDEFKKHAQLDPWTGGIHAAGELFLLRNREFKFKGRTLGHEIAHLVLYRFFGPGIPLWLNEGYAEYVSDLAYASFFRARGYDARPRSAGVARSDFIPLRILTSETTYPGDEKEVGAFYAESERLVRFLRKDGPEKFATFIDATGKGNRMETALSKAYGGDYPSLDALEKAFLAYAIKDHVDAH